MRYPYLIAGAIVPFQQLPFFGTFLRTQRTARFNDTFNPAKVTTTAAVAPSLNLPVSGAAFGAGVFQFPSTELTIDGNIVGTQHIAGLVYISQQSLNRGVGFITGFDYGKGNMTALAKVEVQPPAAMHDWPSDRGLCQDATETCYLSSGIRPQTLCVL